VATTDEIFTGMKWDIIQQLSLQSMTPKEISEKLGTTIANASQQLKLLEAYGYVKKKRIDLGKGSRKQNDRRIVYSIARNTTTITNIGSFNTKRAEIKTHPLHSLMINLLLMDLQENAEPILELYISKKDIFDSVEALFLLEQKQNETHLLIITEKTDIFRTEKSKITIDVGQKEHTIIFWSHSFSEFIEGIKRRESYYLNQWKKSKLLLEIKQGVRKKLEEETRAK